MPTKATTTSTTTKAAPAASADVVEKKTETGRAYSVIGGRYLVWPADVWDDEEPFDVKVPLRFKVGALRPLKDADMNDPAVMLAMLSAIAPGIEDDLDKLDVNDLIAMFGTWFDEYNSEQGATPGEASGSSS